ncbi:hypothetical protein PanWU01x14_266330 [Parasponia andersonii]|uniref:Transmembrane protein n=1 Tax=Parasponia andersonii TaxID=3476 RepID=A0A2P5B714_PARAD|nr:hypothetical protein PanWU01x14_266330 [Parasponia andersonii]
MEDFNTLAGDCVVISCCCQCLILQIVIFVLLKLPYKLIRKTKNFAKKKLQQRSRSGERILINIVERELKGKYKNEIVGTIGESRRIQADQQRRFSFEGGYNSNCGGCMKEVEKVMEELSRKGEFGFGSFWCKEEDSDELIFPKCLAKKGFDHDDHRVVKYHLIGMVGSFSCS